jgi:hypothetical protein
MAVEFLTADVRTRLGSLTLRFFDERDAPTSVELGYEPQGSIEMRYGGSRSSGYGEPVVGSFIDLSIPDPEGFLAEIFTGVFNELNFRVQLDGRIDEEPFRWQGRVQQSAFKKPTGPRTRTDTRRLRVYDRLGGLRQLSPIDRPETLSVEKNLLQLLCAAQPQLPIIYYPDANMKEPFDGSDVEYDNVYPSTRAPVDGNVGDQGDQDDKGLKGNSRREQLEDLATRLGLKVWQEPFTGAWHAVHRAAIGEELSGATKIQGNGYPQDPDATPTINRSHTVRKLQVQVPDIELRSEEEDNFETIEGIKEVTVELSNQPLLKNADFRVYKFENSGFGSTRDFRADFLFWRAKNQNPTYAYKAPPGTSYKNELLGPLREWVGFALYYQDSEAQISQLLPEIPEQDLPIKVSIEYQAIPAFEGESYDFELQLNFYGNQGTVVENSTTEMYDKSIFSSSPLNPPGDSYEFQTDPRREGGRYEVVLKGRYVYFTIYDFKIQTEGPEGTGDFGVNKLEIRPEDTEKGRASRQIEDSSFYTTQGFDQLGARRRDLTRKFFNKSPNLGKETRPAVLPVDVQSTRYGQTYNRVYQYRASDRLAQQPPGLFTLDTVIVPEFLTPGRTVRVQREDERYLFAGGRTLQVTGEESGTTEINDIQLPDVIRDPVDESQIPQQPLIELESYASYRVGSYTTPTNIEGYRLYRRNAPGTPGTEVADDATTQSPYIISAPNPRAALNLHVATAYNGNGESPKTQEVLQTPQGWYQDGDTELSPNPIPSPSAGASNAVLIDQEMYLFGGIDGSGRHARCWKYDVWSDTWTQLPDYPEGPTEGLFACAAPEINEIIVGGGIGPGGARPETYAWDRSVPEWQALGNLEEPVGYAASAQGYGGGSSTDYQVLVVHGGEDASGTPTNAVQRHTVGFTAWGTLSDAPFAERRHGAVYRQSDELWYFFGGAEDRERLWTFNARQDTWSEVSSASVIYPASEYGIAYSNARDSAFLIGGKASGGGRIGPPQEYSFGAGTWTELPAMPTPRNQSRGVFLDSFDILFATGGDDGSPTGINEVRVL